MPEKSKPIRKIDEASKEFIMELLGEEETHGIDIDCIYYIEGRGWIIFEFLKCDTVDPHKSHPNRYPFNWKKFATLFKLSRNLKGELILVNYSKKNKWRDNIKLLFVKNVNIKKVLKDLSSGSRYSEYIEAEEKIMNLSEFRRWFAELNKKAGFPWQ